MASDHQDTPAVIDLGQLTSSAGTARLEGRMHGVGTSLIIVDAPPGTGPELHVHPYPEIFVIFEGAVLFSVGDDEIAASAGQVVIGPAGIPHRFQVNGEANVRMVNVHPNDTFVTTSVSTSHERR